NGSQHDVLDARELRIRHRDRVAVAAQARGDPEDVDLFHIGFAVDPDRVVLERLANHVSTFLTAAENARAFSKCAVAAPPRAGPRHARPRGSTAKSRRPRALRRFDRSPPRWIRARATSWPRARAPRPLAGRRRRTSPRWLHTTDRARGSRTRRAPR